jgi:DNA-binding transcriptional regulator YdaS (Cro superfamily)
MRLDAPNNWGVTPKQVIEHFGGISETARALGVKPPSVSEWKRRGVVPPIRQFQIHLLTDGVLQAGTAPGLGAERK